jgi:predicted AAA+ superfamily ATPase
MDQFIQVIRDKLIACVETPPSALTRRDVAFPKLKGKALTVIGMRRAGKTTYLHQIRRDLLDAGRNPERLVYFNFEDERLAGIEAKQLHLISEAHARLFPSQADSPVALFLDEIQQVPGWEVFVRRMLDTPGYEIYLSGSSAKLLSREIATSMRGRAWEVTIYPFSFREFLRFHGLESSTQPDRLTALQAAEVDHHFADYLATGGFPEAQELQAADRRRLLQGYVDVLLLRDVIERHNVDNPTALRWMVRRLLGNSAGLFSITKFAADLKSQGIAVGRETLYELLDHLVDAFLLYAVPVATDSEKRRQVNPRKVYPADTGLIPVFDRSGKANIGHALETAVFMELQRRGAEVGYVRTKDGFEVDFLARNADGTEDLIQVCADPDDPETLAREVRALESAAAAHPQARQWLLTLESRVPFPDVPEPIRILPAWQWVLER